MVAVTRQFILGLIFIALFGLLFIASPSAVSAADITVTDTCSLSDAIRSANDDRSYDECTAGSGNDVININSDITLDGAAETIRSVITIKGLGANRTIDGSSQHQIFTVHGDDSSSVKLTVQDLTLQNGAATRGGAIYVQFAALDIKSSHFENNSASDWGGAVAVYAGTATVSDSTFEGNTAEDGGAIYNQDISPFSGNALEIRRSTFKDNAANGTYSVSRGYGGAIENSAGSLLINRSSFQSNNAAAGGAIAGGLSAAKIEIENTTFYQNTADYGGAILADGAEILLRNNTFSDNSAPHVGGLYALTSATRVKLYNTIIVGSGVQCDATLNQE